MRISDWSSDVCSSDLLERGRDASFRVGEPLVQDLRGAHDRIPAREAAVAGADRVRLGHAAQIAHQREGIGVADRDRVYRSEEHTSELQSLMRISYAVFCLKKKTIQTHSYN